MRKLIVAATFAALALPAAAQAQDYGPNTCLNGFVWREAFPGDAVCVKPQVRSDTKADNAAAVSRRDPSAGYGPKGCKQGFVWREARASDLVCVIPSRRTQAKNDNAAAAARRNSIKVTAFSSGGRWHLNVTNINNGRALIVLKAPGGGKSWTAGVSGNRFSLATGRPDCRGSANSYFLVQDPISKRVGRSQNVSANCVRID